MIIQREEFLRDYPGVRLGLDVYAEDGEKLGKVAALEEEVLVIEKGRFFPRQYTAQYSDVVGVGDDRLTLGLSSTALDVWNEPDEREAS